jgi:glycosyltransferase involved in cell wall biosynthesis/O-antigen/teichoic acid export membrane protein
VQGRQASPPAPRQWGSTLSAGGACILGALLIQNAGNFAFHAAAARIVGPSAYGALGTLLTLTVALTIPLAALQTAITRSVAEAGDSADSRGLLRRAAVGAVGVAIVLAVAGPFIDSFLHLGSTSAAALLGPYAGAAGLAAVTRGVAVGWRRFDVAASSIAGAVAVRVVSGIVFTAWLGIDGAMLGTFIGEAAGVAIAWRATRNADASVPVRLPWALTVDTFAMTLGVWLLGSVDVLIAGHSLVGRDRALYVAAGTAARAVLVLPQAVVMIAMPRFVATLRDDRRGHEAWRALRDAMGLALCLTVVGIGAIVLAGGRLLTITFGRGFAKGGTVLVLCALATVPVALASMLATFHFARHSRLALLPWIGMVCEFAATATWHASPQQLATSALAGASIQVAVTAVVMARERRAATSGSGSVEAASGEQEEVGSRAATVASTSPYGEPDRLHILVLAWRDLAHPQAGGSEVYVEQLARRWVAGGHEVTLCSAAVEGRPARERVEGVDIVRAGNRLTVYRNARRFVSEHRDFDVIVDCVNTKPFDAPRVAGSTPVVALIHQVAREVWWYEAPLPAAALGRFVLEPRWLRRYRDVPTLTISDSSKESLITYGIRDVTVLPVGIDDVDPAAPSAKAAIPTLAFCGRLVRSKRANDAIAAFERVRTRMPEARLTIIGSGPMARRIARRHHPGVELAGWCSASTKQQILGSAHALLATSVREGWGLIVSEAAALGTPTAGYDVAGLRDSIAAAGGIATTADPRVLGDALLEMLPQWIDRPPRPRPWGGAASWDETANATLAALVRAIGGTRVFASRQSTRTHADPEPDPEAAVVFEQVRA